MAQGYNPPEAPFLTKNPKPTNQPVNLLEETNGYMYFKMYTTDEGLIPEGLPEEPPRQASFPTFNKVRQDDGLKVYECDRVSAELFRHGIANANGHEWGLINAGWWEQPITNPRMRAKLGRDTQFVIKFVYCAHPNQDGRDGLMTLSRVTLNALRLMAREQSWMAHVWNNHHNGGPLTINLTSPKHYREVAPEHKIVVRGGCLRIISIYE